MPGPQHPSSPHEHRGPEPSHSDAATGFTTRPLIMGTHGVVTSGHYLATAAGFRIMAQGGNAIDAAAAMCFCLNLLEPQSNGIGGEVPTLIYSAVDKRPYAVSGMGWAPKAFTLDWCREHQIDLIPGDGYLPACVPSVVDTWAVALSRFGTLTFSEVLQPALDLARNGFPVYAGLHHHLAQNLTTYTDQFPTTGAIYCPHGRAPSVGDVLTNPDFADMLDLMCEAERSAAESPREVGIRAARDVFYKGVVAEKIVEFITTYPVIDASGKAHHGLLSRDDLSEWHAHVEDPVSLTFRGVDVYKCSTWTQGPVFLQQLALLDGFDLHAMRHNSAEYLHTLMECAKLAFADREAYYGDPCFDHPPLDVLLSSVYADERRTLVDTQASHEMRPGSAGGHDPAHARGDVADDNRQALGLAGKPPHAPCSNDLHVGDTTHLDAIDRAGNMVSATPSGGWLATSPVIPTLGFPLGTRGQMFYLNEARPNALAPRKRPRATLTPSLALRDGNPFMVFGTPGGDHQDQWTLQFFLNYVVFGMDLQEALDAPTVHTSHFPSSFYPRVGHLGQVSVESRIPSNVIAELRQRGHDIVEVGPWANGKVLAIRFDDERGVIAGGASPKGVIGYTIGW